MDTKRLTKNHWFNKKRWYHRINRWFRRLEPVYWIKSVLIEKHHLIDLRGMDHYKWGYIDECERMKLAMWKCLVDYVELEAPFEVIDWDDGEVTQSIGKEIKDLYRWWKWDRTAESKAIDDILKGFDMSLRFIPNPDGTSTMDMSYADAPEWKLWKEKTDEFEEKERKMLERVLAIRIHLWT